MPEAGKPAIDRSTRVWRNADLLVTEVNGEVVMMNVEAGEYYGLGDIGSEIWNQLAEPVTVEALLATMEANYEADAGTIEADMIAFLSDLAGRNLIRTSP